MVLNQAGCFNSTLLCKRFNMRPVWFVLTHAFVFTIGSFQNQGSICLHPQGHLQPEEIHIWFYVWQKHRRVSSSPTGNNLGFASTISARSLRLSFRPDEARLNAIPISLSGWVVTSVDDDFSNLLSRHPMG